MVLRAKTEKNDDERKNLKYLIIKSKKDEKDCFKFSYVACHDHEHDCATTRDEPFTSPRWQRPH